MGFSLAHIIAQPLGWGARAVGAAQNVLPGAGDSSLNQVGRAITSGTATLSNPGGLFTGAPAFTEGPVPGGARPAGGGAPAAPGQGTYVNGMWTAGGAGGAPADPNAAARASWLGNLGSAVGNIRNNASDAFGSGARSLQGSAESLFNSIKQGQQGIDTSRENIELNRLNGVKDILGFVRSGLRQGGSRLANMNAGESSAAGEIARQFGLIGSDRMRTVGNSSFLQNREQDTAQSALDLKRGQGRTDLSRTRDDMVATIGQQVREQLANLDSQGAQLGATGQVDVEGEKQRVIDAGIGALNNIDSWLQGQLGGINPEDAAKIKTNAVALQQGGTSDITPFDFGQFPGMQVQGPAVDQLPLFTKTRKISATA